VRPRGKGSVRRRWVADGDESRGGMRKPLVASGGGFEASSVKLVGDGGSAAQGLPARGVKAALGAGCCAKAVHVCVRGQGEPKPGSHGAGVFCRRPATAEQRRVRWRSAGALCPGRRSGLRAKTTSLKGRGGLGGAHRGVMWLELRCSEVVGEVRRRKGAELAEEGRRRGPPGVWAVRIGARSSCEVGGGVSGG
jgi:hypothetical protein